MAEYIERAETAEFFEKSKQTMWHKDDIAATISSNKNIPTADVVEVVRCSKCQHRDKSGLCQAEGQKLTVVKDNHFCSKGEKRTIPDETLSSETKQVILDDFMKNSEQ